MMRKEPFVSILLIISLSEVLAAQTWSCAFPYFHRQHLSFKIQDVDAYDEKEAALLVKGKQEPVKPSLRCGAFHVVWLFLYLLYSVQFVFGYCLCPSTLVENVDKGFNENRFETAPLSSARLDP